MSITVDEVDIVAGSSLVMDSNGTTDRRRFKVSGLRGNTTPSGVRWAALQALIQQKNVYYHSSHPDIPVILCGRISVEPFRDSTDAVYLTAEYMSPQQAGGGGGTYTVRIISANGTQTLSHDGNGKLLSVTYNDPTDLATNNPKKNYVNLVVESSNTIIEISRQETGSPLAKSRAYRNCVNSQPIWGFAAKELLCRAIDGDEILGLPQGTIWQVTYRFEGGPNLDSQKHSIWEQVSIFRDLNTGRIPDRGGNTINPEDGTNDGYAWFLPYPQVDFSPLALPNVSL